METINNDSSLKDGLISKDKLIALKKNLIGNETVIVICGPTCSGKTRAALNLAMLLDTDIISADSMQAFRYMDIGTDKQDLEKFSVKQFMINICDPDYRLTAVEFRDIARKVIKEEFFNKNKIPIIAGGSGLHIRAIIDDLMCAPDSTHELKKEIKEKIKLKGLDYYYNELKKMDMEYALKISSNDERRIVRALEVCYSTNRKFSDYLTNWEERKSIYNCVMIGLNTERKSLYDNIDKRVKEMIKKGLLEEVSLLYERGYSGCNSITQAIGYKELIKYLDGEMSLDESIEEIKKNTRHLAKKQLTWFKADGRINWVESGSSAGIKDIMKDILSIINLKVEHGRI